MEKSLAYTTAVEIRERFAALLFQRLHFFLLTMAFIIAGLVASYAVDSAQNLTAMTNIRLSILILGIVLSLLFMIVIFWNTRILAAIRDYTLELERKNFQGNIQIKDRPYRRIESILSGLHQAGMWWNLLGRLISELSAYSSVLIGIMIFRDSKCSLLKRISGWVSQITEQGIAPHTWAIPLIFLVLWIVLCFLLF